MQELGKMIERGQHLTFKDKCHLMAETLRNCKLDQTVGSLHEGNKFCAYGALGFRAGIPKNELDNAYFRVLGAYGITDEEGSRLYRRPYDADYEDTFIPFNEMIWRLNDNHWGFDEVATWLDSLE